MKKFLVQTVLLIIVIGVSLVFFSPASKTPQIDIPFLPQSPTFKELQINDAKFKVEIADTPSKRSKGLAGRDSLKDNEGMLFIFSKLTRTPFWMKGLKFGLDFIFIKGDKIVDVIKNVPPPALGQTDASLPIYQPKEEVDQVLEINSGLADKLSIKVGDNIKVSD